LGGLALAAAMVAGAGAHAVQTPSSTTGTILGRVVDADAGTPLSGVLVTAVPATQAAAGGEAPQRPQAIVSDAHGRFLFTDLPAGTYALRASVGGTGFSVGGFVVSGMGHQIGAYLNGGFGQRRPDGPMQTMELEAGGRVRDAVIRLWKGGAISGRILDEAAEPLVDVVVSAVRRASDGRLLTGPTVRTDDRGMYRLGTLTPGSYVIVVPQTQTLMPASTIEAVLSAPPDRTLAARFASAGAPVPAEGGVPVGTSIIGAPSQTAVTNTLLPADPASGRHVYQTTFHPSVAAASQAIPITIRSGQERADVDVHLQPVRAAEVSGILLGDDGPVPNFGVHLMPADSGDGASIIEVAATATDAAGAFVFPLVPAGSYMVMAVRAGSVGAPVTTSPAADPLRLAETPGAWASMSITVGSENLAGVVLTLRPGVRVSGRMEFEGVGEPPSADRLRGLTVTMRRVQPLSRTTAGTVTRRVGPDGRFTVQGVVPGRYVITARDPLPPWTLRSITSAGDDVTDLVLTLGDRDLDGVTVTFTDQPATIEGTVASAGRAVADDASVFLFPADRRRWPDARASTRTFRSERVSKSGAFRLPAVIPGEYVIVAASDDLAGDWPDVSVLETLAEGARVIRVQQNQTQRLDLRLGSIR
jgi:hypothetical protein